MPTYEVTAPDGAKYEVTAPEGATESEVLEYAKANFGVKDEVSQGSPNMLRGLTNLAAQGATFGFADEIGGAGAATGKFLKSAAGDVFRGDVPDIGRALEAGGQGYDEATAEIRAEADAFRKASPFLATGAEMVGGLGGAAGATQLVGKMFGPVKAGVWPAARRGIAEGAIYGGLYGAGTGEGGADRLQKAAAGAATGALAGGAMGAAGGAMAQREARKAIPALDELQDEARFFYDKMENAGVRVSQPGYKKVVDQLTKAADRLTFRKGLHPRVATALAEIDDAVGSEQTLTALDQARRVLGVAARSSEADERRVASGLIDALDDAIDTLKPSDVVAGNVTEGAKALRMARGYYKRLKKAETIDTLIDRAGVRAGQFSGSGFENALRTEFRQLALNPKRLRGFSKAEKAAIRKVSSGGPIDNLLRTIGKAAPTGIVSGALGSGMGYAIGGPTGAFAVPAIGAAARAGATAGTLSNARLASALSRAGGQLPTAPISGGMRAIGGGAGVLTSQQVPRIITDPTGRPVGILGSQ